MDSLDSDSAQKPLPIPSAVIFSMSDDKQTLRRKRLCAMLAAEFGDSAKILPSSIARR